MRILYVTDLHGDRRKYERALELATSQRFDVVINGGDMLPHARDTRLQADFIAGFLDDHLARLDAAGIHYLCYLGNDDLRIFDEMLDDVCSRHRFAAPIAQRKFDLAGVEFIGMNWVVDYPFRLKDRCRMDTSDYEFQEQLGTGLLSSPDGWIELGDWRAYARTLPTIEDELRALVRPGNPSACVYVIHMPPARAGLDRCADGRDVGSVAVREFLLERQPMLSLHGHIHESPQLTGRWLARLGQTVSIQPGQDVPLTWVSIDLDRMEFARRCDGSPM